MLLVQMGKETEVWWPQGHNEPRFPNPNQVRTRRMLQSILLKPYLATPIQGEEDFLLHPFTCYQGH